MKDIYIHVGMAKALSTSLRNSFFPKVDNSFLVYGEHNIQNPIHKLIKFLSIMQEKYKSLINYENIIQEDSYKEIKIEIRHFLLNCEKKIIISWPSFIGSMGGARDNFKNLDCNAQIINDIFGSKTKILIIIRRQDHYSFSLYNTVIKRGFNIKFEDFINLEENLNSKKEDLILNPLLINYAKFYETYCNYFSKDKILFIPYEKFLKSKKSFEQELSDFFEQKNLISIDVHKNKSLSIFGYKLLITINCMKDILKLIFLFADKKFNLNIKNKLNNLNQKKGISRKFYNIFLILDNFFTYFSQSSKNQSRILYTKKKIKQKCMYLNKKLDEKYNLNLKEYEYY